jgi:hypothetical protein
LSREERKARLLGSEAVTSLASELRIAARLREFGWSTSHGSFFVDPITDKLRETDVLAKRLWQPRPDFEDQIAHLDLIVEVKSIGGYHLVFAPSSFSPSYANIERTWIGYASERSASQAQLTEALKRADVELNDISLILERFSSLAYPDGEMIVRDLVLNPPPAPFAASAFRETNIGGQKDLNASVLWKAAQTLSSFVNYASTDYMAGSFSFIEFVTDYARLRSLDVVDTVLDELARMVQRVRLFHAVIVVDATLWALKNGDLEEIPWCRFHRLDKDGLVSTWYDVVQSKVLNDYLHLTTEHYDKGMEEVGAKR